MDQSEQPMPTAEESMLFWSELWDNSVEHNAASSLKGLKNDQQVEAQEELMITVDKIKKQLKKMVLSLHSSIDSIRCQS